MISPPRIHRLSRCDRRVLRDWPELTRWRKNGLKAKGGRWKSDGASTAGEINGTLFRRGGTFPRTTLWLYGRSDSLIAVALDGVSLKRIVGSMPAGQSSMSNARCTPRRSRLCAPTANSSSGRGAPRIEARRAGAHAPGARLSEAGRKGELPISRIRLLRRGGQDAGRLCRAGRRGNW
jgi:hypothetical protein